MNGTAARQKRKPCVEGLQCAIQLCMQLVSMARNLARDRSETRSVTEEAKGLARLLTEWKISQVKRDCNIASALVGLV
jgi:hypothetical protein